MMQSAPQIWVRNKKIIETSREPIGIQRPLRVAGEFMLRGMLDDGRNRDILGWQKNLILNTGLERWGNGTPISAAVVGSGSTAPTESDTALQTFVAGTTNLVSTTGGVEVSSPYRGYLTVVLRFDPPGVDRTIRELGVGWAATGGSLFARALAKNTQGVPEEFDWLAAETLELTYRLWLENGFSDQAYSVTMSVGGTPTEFTGIVRPAYVGNGTYTRFPNRIVTLNTRSDGGATVNPVAYNGTIGTADSVPSGTSGAGTWETLDAYVSSSRERTGVARWGVTQGNLAGGITALLVTSTMYPFQVSFSPAIAKVADWTLDLNIKSVKWGRA